MNTASLAIPKAPDVHGSAKAWTAFWADPVQSRCAAGAPLIWQSLSNHWISFARSLAHGTGILDLGCGAGVVGRLLVDARPDLHVLGIDSASVPGASHPRIELRSNVAMESLSLPERGFGAVVSQFGFEYSNTQATSREISRLLAPGAKLSLVVHHAGSAIVAATRMRLKAMRAFLAPALRTGFCSGDAVALRTQLSALREEFPDDTLIAELARALSARIGVALAVRVAIFRAIEEALEPELRVSKSLDECCVAPSRIDEWLQPLREACELSPAAVLREPNGAPVAWIIEGTSRRKTA